MPTVKQAQQKPKPRQHGEGSIFYRAADNRWLVRVRENGAYRQIGSVKLPDKKEAERKARDILDQYHQDLQDGLDPAGRDWLTVDWLEHCLSQKEPRYDKRGNLLRGVEPTTFEKYETQTRLHIVPYVGPILAPRLVDNRREHVQRWFDALVDQGWGADLLNEALQRLSGAYELAVDYDLVRKNPCRGIERVKPAERQHVKPSELDLVRLIRAIKGDPLEALPWIALGGGFRRGETAALEWADITIFSPEHGQIRTHQRRNRLGRRAQQRLGLPGDLQRARNKSHDERTVDIGATVIAILERRWHQQVLDRRTAGSQWQGTTSDTPDGYVFTTPVGTRLQVDAISKYLKRVRERAGLDIQRFHALRRVFATLLNKAGVPDRVTMELGGWSDLDITHYYQDPMASQKQAASQALDVELRRLLDAANE